MLQEVLNEFSDDLFRSPPLALSLGPQVHTFEHEISERVHRLEDVAFHCDLVLPIRLIDNRLGPSP